jgi:hypothetical protein
VAGDRVGRVTGRQGDPALDDRGVQPLARRDHPSVVLSERDHSQPLALELVSQQLSRVAAVSSNVPNIHGEQIAFRSMVEVDLRLSISEGYDRLVLDGLATAGTLTAGTAGDVIQKVRRGISQLATAGYAADTLVFDAPGAESLDLLRSSGSEAFYVWSPGNFAGDLFNLNRVSPTPPAPRSWTATRSGGCTPARCRYSASRSMRA